MRTTDHPVVIVGGGPTGLMLAGELALAGIDVAIVERRASQELDGSRARGLHARTIEVLDQRGIADHFLTEGYTAQVQVFAGVLVDISDFPTRHNYGLALLQSHFERILAEWVREVGVSIVPGREVTGFAQDDAGVDVIFSEGPPLRAEYLVGCDGGRSTIRKTAGIEFPGSEPTMSWLIAEVEMTDEPEIGLRGGGGIGPAEGGRFGIVLAEPELKHRGEPTLDEVRAALIAVDGTDHGAHSPTWLSRFTDASRQAATYRDRRVLIAGDAAHIHPPQGGQGLNIGVQDSVNLGWKLAQVIRGTSPDALLDTYEAERWPVGARVIRNAMAQGALRRTDMQSKALAEVFTELLQMDEPRKSFAAMVSGLDVRYDLGEGHPMLGRRVPDLEVATASGPVRLFTLLHRARAVFVNFGVPVSITPWSDRVDVVDATFAGAIELPVVGTVETPSALLIRPDGHVAWTGADGQDGLIAALTRWFGPA